MPQTCEVAFLICFDKTFILNLEFEIHFKVIKSQDGNGLPGVSLKGHSLLPASNKINEKIVSKDIKAKRSSHCR